MSSDLRYSASLFRSTFTAITVLKTKENTHLPSQHPSHHPGTLTTLGSRKGSSCIDAVLDLSQVPCHAAVSASHPSFLSLHGLTDGLFLWMKLPSFCETSLNMNAMSKDVATLWPVTKTACGCQQGCSSSQDLAYERLPCRFCSCLGFLVPTSVSLTSEGQGAPGGTGGRR